MNQLIIEGGSRLYGEINISGMKNSALPVIYACILIKENCILQNIPRVSDVENSIEILNNMGANAYFIDNNTLFINTSKIDENVSGYELISKMRASSYLMGAMLSRFHKVKLPMPGGCNFGTRPIDLHLDGFKKMGADICFDGTFVSIKAENGLKCCKITLDKISVGATINMIIASVLTKGTTIIENVAKEPHVDDLIQFLNDCGAKIVRVCNSIVIIGVEKLHGTTYRVFPDMIEALTYITFVGITKGELLLTGIEYDHLKTTCNYFKKMGFIIKSFSNKLSVKVEQKVHGINVSTSPYPGFPTDLHPQFSSLLCFSEDGGEIVEEVFPTRFQYVDELKRLGARIQRTSNMVKVFPSEMYGSSTYATDLRAGASLVAASLGCKGITTINNVNYIVRGYESLVDKISSIGGKIKLI